MSTAVEPSCEPKGADWTSPAQLPPARFCWSTVVLSRVLALASARAHPPSAHPAFGGTRKPSVPGRVHSVPKSYGSQATSLLAVQPVSDSRHGRIACKVFLSCTVAKFQLVRRAAASNQSQGLSAPTPSLAGGCSPNSTSSSGWPVRETPVWDHSHTCRP